MQLTRESADDLCQRVVERLIAWPIFPAVLQVGGIESRASSQIMLALEDWLMSQERTDLLIIPEYRLSDARPPDETTDSRVAKAADELFRGKRIDYALVKKESIGKANLKVDTVIEVKTNYVGQAELRKRPADACKQARDYALQCGADQWYVLYLVAWAVGQPPDGRRDAGWGYFRSKPGNVSRSGPLSAEGVRILSCFPNNGAGSPVKWPEDAPNLSAWIWAYVLQG